VPTADAAVSIASVLRSNAVANIVVDPVISSTSGFELADERAVEAVANELFPLATLVTPNITEAERFAGIVLSDERALHGAANTIMSKGARSVLIKGGHFEPESALSRDFLFKRDDVTIHQSQRELTVSVRGTGCMLSSAIAANLALGRGLDNAVQVAKEYVRGMIAAAADEANAEE
jgi:hydroxymethylpyrimidine/phosphomethylpyrimidine kinase